MVICLQVTTDLTRRGSRPLPARANGNAVVVKVSCGLDHTAAVTADGALWTWGHGHAGVLGHGDEEDSLVPLPPISRIMTCLCEIYSVSLLLSCFCCDDDAAAAADDDDDMTAMAMTIHASSDGTGPEARARFTRG